MLENSFYKIIAAADNVYTVELLPSCPVYRGHFPGEPVSPGVCSIQMIKELTEKATGRRLLLSNLKQVRFRTLITPVTHSRLAVTLNATPADGRLALAATIAAGTDLCVELRAELDYKD